MKCWTSATQSEQFLFTVISKVFQNHSYLMTVFFDPERPKVRQAPNKLLENCRGYSSGEFILIRIALDIWCGSGEAKLNQILETLDLDNLANVLEALKILAFKTSDN